MPATASSTLVQLRLRRDASCYITLRCKTGWTCVGWIGRNGCCAYAAKNGGGGPSGHSGLERICRERVKRLGHFHVDSVRPTHASLGR
mmetsp:Transcript_24999/g.42512  ORF Transcript_24999/g.42512 Transcript_24999/m.42512 type:complete len:88 (+) Transcript_24999:3133-3396(+)